MKRAAVIGPSQRFANGLGFLLTRCACGLAVLGCYDRCVFCELNATREPRS